MQEIFGKYRLIDRLALGGMAEVFLASAHGEAGFSKPVVIKRLHPRLSEDDEFTQMLIDEARITSLLNHGNICQVLDLGQLDGSYYIAMEYVPGEDLRTFQDHFRRNKTHMPVGAAVYVVSELLAALDYAHRQEDADGKPLGVIHRDVSPQNVLISYEGDVKIIDFGIAKARQRLVQTQAGVIKGKFRYMSPEQASGGKVDHRTDIFAAGVVLYELLRGEPHSLDVPDTDVLRRMRDAEFDPIERGREEVPDELLRIVSRALQRSPRKRYSAAGEFRQALVDFLPKIGTGGSKPARLFGRMDLEALMKDVFPAERRRRRSGSSHRKAVEKSSAAHGKQTDSPTGHPSGRLETRVATPDTGKAVPARDPLLDAPPLPRESTTPIHLADEQVVGRAADRAPPLSDGEPVPAGVSGSSQAVTAGRQSSASDGPSTARWTASTTDPDGVLPTAPRGSGRPAAQGRRPISGAGVFTRGTVDPIDHAGVDRSAGGSGQGGDWARTVQEGGSARSPSVEGLQATRIESSSERTQPGRRRSGGLGKIVGLLLLAGGLAGGAFYAGRYFMPSEGGQRDLPGFLKLWGASDPDAGVAQQLDDLGPEPAPEAALAELRVRSKPSGATIRLCGRVSTKRTPAVLRMRSGRRCILRLSLRGYLPYELPVRGTPGQPMSIKARMRRAGASSPSRHSEPRVARAEGGTLIVTSIRIGTVYVNNEEMGKTPKLQLKLPPGHYTVWMLFPGLGVQTGTRSVRIEAGGRSRLHFDPTM